MCVFVCVAELLVVHVHLFLLLGEKMDADTMDEKRKEHMAYEYLCHLEEAKQLVTLSDLYSC